MRLDEYRENNVKTLFNHETVGCQEQGTTENISVFKIRIHYKNKQIEKNMSIYNIGIHINTLIFIFFVNAYIMNIRLKGGVLCSICP